MKDKAFSLFGDMILSHNFAVRKDRFVEFAPLCFSLQYNSKDVFGDTERSIRKCYLLSVFLLGRVNLPALVM